MKKKIETVFIWGNVNKKSLREVFSKLLKIFEKHNVKFFLNKELAEFYEYPAGKTIDVKNNPNLDYISQVDIAVILGGDGTVIHAARTLLPWEIPILGINLGHLGFLTELDPLDIEVAIPAILEGKYVIEERMMLKAFCEDIMLLAMNEFVLSKGKSPRFVRLNIEVNGEHVSEIYADGIVVSTPTGSTAYSMSLGGSILAPGLKGILFTAMAPHMLTFRPFVVSSNDVIRIYFESLSKRGVLHLSGDGQKTETLVKKGTVLIKKCDKKTQLVKYHDRSFYSLLQEKFGWGSIPGVMKYGTTDDSKFSISNPESEEDDESR